MAKSKTESEPLPLDKQVEELKAKNLELEAAVRTLTLEKSQAEGELARVKADPFLSREGHTAFIEKVYEMMWVTARRLSKSHMQKEMNDHMAVLRGYLGEPVTEGIEKRLRS